MDRNWELLGALRNAKIRQPTLFLAGEQDVVVAMYRGAFDVLEQTVPGLRGKHLIPSAGHWLQQEKPLEVTQRMIAFLRQQRGTSGFESSEHRTAKSSV
jgi:pimeloyl-ACP methyl ester carboxylesterase